MEVLKKLNRFCKIKRCLYDTKFKLNIDDFEKFLKQREDDWIRKNLDQE